MPMDGKEEVVQVSRRNGGFRDPEDALIDFLFGSASEEPIGHEEVFVVHLRKMGIREALGSGRGLFCRTNPPARLFFASATRIFRRLHFLVMRPWLGTMHLFPERRRNYSFDNVIEIFSLFNNPKR
jgi:hypothetical protein